MSDPQPPRLTLSTDEARAIETIDPATFNAGLAPVRGVSAELLRARFRDNREWRHEMLGDGQFEDMSDQIERGYKRASVLVPIVARGNLSVLLTQRPAHMKDHAGQISFPGGRAEAFDTSAIDTALRETEEEIGLSRERIEVIGTLPHYHTVTNYEVTPVVALVHPPFDLAPDAREVAEAFEVPLSFILDPANHQKRSRPWEGKRRYFYAMPYDRHFIWGATAAMLRNLYHFMRA